MENKVYVVQSHGGEYEDSWDHIVGIFTDKDKAIAAAEEDWDIQGNWQAKMKVPFKVYVQNITNFDYKEDDFDSSPEEYDDIDYIFYDYMGYTKEEWEQSSILYERNIYHSYCWTDVHEYPENSIIRSCAEKVWMKYSATETMADWDDDDYEVTDTFEEETV